MPSSSSLRFSAIPLGKMSLPHGQPIRLLRLTPEDIPFLERGLAKMAEPGAQLTPNLTGVNYANHEELIKEGFEKSIEQLKKSSTAQEKPVVLVATDDAHTLQGLCLAHIERTRPDGKKVYSPLPDHKKGPITPHSSNNWLVTLSKAKGIGKSLLAMLEDQIPKKTEMVDTVAELESYTPQAIPLYEKMGFRKQPQLNNKDFESIHGYPMRATRFDFWRAAKAVCHHHQFKRENNTAPVNLAKFGEFPHYAK